MVPRLDGGEIPLRIVHVPGKAPPHRVRPRRRRVRPRLVPGLLRHRLPDRQVRHDRSARLRRRGDGEPRAASPTARTSCSSTPPSSTQAEQQSAGRRDHPRARPHVVRRPRDDELVERHLAERGVRHVHGDRLLRRLPPRLEAVGDVQPRAQRRVRDRLAGGHTRRSSSRSRSPTTARACSTCSRTRRAAPCCACSSSTSARTSSVAACSHYLTDPRVRQHRDRATCGTRSRRSTRSTPVRRMMDSWIWQPGYPLVTRTPRRRRTWCCRSSGSPSTTRRSATRRHVVRRAAARAQHRRPIGSTDECKVLLDGDELRVHLGHPDAADGGQRRRPRLRPRRLRRHAAQPARRAAISTHDRRRAVQPGRRRLERRWWPVACGAPSC